MPAYRNGYDGYQRKPKMYYEEDLEPEQEFEEDEEEMERKPPKKHQNCFVECPFKIIVKLVPGDCRKHPPMV